jgi:hypothetical protein
MTDVRQYATELHITMLGTDKQDAKATLDEVCSRLFGEECIVSISAPSSESIKEVKSHGT